MIQCLLLQLLSFEATVSRAKLLAPADFLTPFLSIFSLTLSL
uniref:Uncharacterized protein n=1 Tax=Arundo donax TaxID=35708 RepID=A0A0A9B215_ARUDO